MALDAPTERPWLSENWRWQDILNLLVGVWLALSPFPFIGISSSTHPSAIVAYIVGVAIALFSVDALSRGEIWEEWVNLSFAVVLLAAPFVLGFVGTTAGLNFFVCGLIVLIGSLWAGLVARGRTSSGDATLPPHERHP